MIKPTERTGARSWLKVRSRRAVESAAVIEAAVAEITVAVAEVTMMEPVVTKIPAVRDPFVMIEERSTAMPVVAPVMPAPAISSEEADTKSNAKGNAGPTPVNPGHEKPAWIRDDRLTVHEPGAEGGNKNDNRGVRFNDEHVALPP